jgi:hypothetical protein
MSGTGIPVPAILPFLAFPDPLRAGGDWEEFDNDRSILVKFNGQPHGNDKLFGADQFSSV